MVMPGLSRQASGARRIRQGNHGRAAGRLALFIAAP
jgi:hypothetical protein